MAHPCEPKTVSSLLGKHGGTLALVKAEEGSYWLGDMLLTPVTRSRPTTATCTPHLGRGYFVGDVRAGRR